MRYFLLSRLYLLRRRQLVLRPSQFLLIQELQDGNPLLRMLRLRLQRFRIQLHLGLRRYVRRRHLRLRQCKLRGSILRRLFSSKSRLL